MFVILACAAAATALQQPWLDASLPIPKRVELLMNEMTLTERARQTYAVRITTYLSQGWERQENFLSSSTAPSLEVF